MESARSHTAPQASIPSVRRPVGAVALHRFWPLLLLAVGILLAAWTNLRGYLLPELNVWLALLSLPFVLYVRDPKRRSWRFALAGLLLMGLFMLLHIKITYHLAVCFSLLFLAESAAGRLNSMPVALLLVLSPLPHYFASVLGFPLRLWLSELAGGIFNLIGMEVEVRGNMFLQNGAEFAVDPACTGIQLFVTGLVAFVILVSYQEKRQKKSLPLPMQAGFLALGMGLVLLANLFRIILLVLLRSEPESFSHDAVGMACLIFYFVVPMAFVLRWSIRRWGRAHSHDGSADWMPPGRAKMGMGAFLVIGLFATGYLGQRPENFEQRFKLEAMEVDGFQSCITNDGVLALENEQALVYLKPPVPFYGADHYPEICWRAGGFKVRAPETATIGGREVMLARLENEEQRYYTAWWYDNGEVQTISPIRWRWGQLRGENGFYLVNITVADQSDLECVVGEWQKMDVVGEAVSGL